jgi:hypothetical protein
MKAVVPYGSLMSARTAGTLAFVWWGLTRCVAGIVSDGFVPLTLLSNSISTALALAIALFAFSARSRGRIAWRLVSGGLLLCVAEVVFVIARTLPHHSASTALVIASVAIGAVLSGGLAAAYSGLLGWLIGRHVEAPSREGDDRAQVIAGTWVLGSQAPALLFALMAFAMKGRFPALHQAWATTAMVRTLAVPILLGYAAPAALAISALSRIRARRRWLERVRVGELPHWRIVELASPAARIPHLVDVGQGPTATLVRVHDAGQPFRESETQEPIAVVAGAKTSASA